MVSMMLPQLNEKQTSLVLPVAVFSIKSKVAFPKTEVLGKPQGIYIYSSNMVGTSLTGRGLSFQRICIELSSFIRTVTLSPVRGNSLLF